MAGFLVLVLGLVPLHGVILRVTAPAVGSQVVDQPHPAGWRRFEAPDGAFEVVGPSTPSIANVTTEMGVAHEARFTEGLRVVWSDVPISSASDRQILSEVVARSIRPLVGLVADEESDLVVAGHPGFGISLTSDGRHLAMRAFVAGGRFFEVIGVAPAGAGGADAEAFVRSFILDL
jgi:hypothetical protein